MSLHGVDKAPHGSASCSEVLILGLFLSPLYKLVCVYPGVAGLLAKQREHQGAYAGFVLPTLHVQPR